MKQNLKANLAVNNKEVKMNPFVQSYVSNVAMGIVSSLKGVDYISLVEIKLEKDSVTIKVNKEDITLTPFPNDIIASTMKGLVSSLKGVNDIKTIEIHLK